MGKAKRAHQLRLCQKETPKPWKTKTIKDIRGICLLRRFVVWDYFYVGMCLLGIRALSINDGHAALCPSYGAHPTRFVVICRDVSESKDCLRNA